MPLPGIPFRPIAAGGHVIEGSGLFDGSTGYLSRTYTTSATHSGVIVFKRAKLGAVQPLLDNVIYFNASDQLVCNGLTSTAIFRDPGAWYALFWNGTAPYINGVQITGTGSYSTAALVNERVGYDGTNFADEYIAQVGMGDGQTWALSDSGEATDDGYWQINKVSGLTFGTEGFLIEGGTDMAAGTDSSGNGNDFAKTGTITATNDSPTDDADNGYGLYPTWFPSWSGSLLTLTLGNLQTSGFDKSAKSSLALPSSGKWYWEHTIAASGSIAHTFGIQQDSGALSTTLAAWSDSYGYKSDGNKYTNGGSGTAYGATFTNSDTIGVAYDADAGELEFFKNNVSQGTAFTGISSAATWFQAHQCQGSAEVSTNFGATAFSYTPPTGYEALSTATMGTGDTVTSGTNSANDFVYTGGLCESVTWNSVQYDRDTHDNSVIEFYSNGFIPLSGSSIAWTAVIELDLASGGVSQVRAQGNG